MGYDMFIIAPHHSDDQDDIDFPLNNCELYKDPWYENKDNIDYSHQIWHCWRDGELDDRTKLVGMLGITLIYSPWSDGFREEMNDFFKSTPSISEYSIDEVTEYLDWINYWKQKEAKFYLSV